MSFSTNLARRFLAGLAIAAAMAAPAGAQSTDGFGRHLADLINRYRETHGLAPLVMTQDLVTLAPEHSSTMAKRRRLTHEGFDVMYRRTGSRVCVENVGSNHRTAETLMDGWRHSPDHLRKLLEPKVSRMGIAANVRYVTFFACLY
jgi:uncharacterized protein YkwD